MPVTWRALVLLFVLVALPSAASAQPSATCPELPCSIIRNCSSTGIACRPDDRVCADEARTKNLEVKCEQECSDGRRLVYCPPDTGRADDSRIVWILLVVAVVIAVAGGAVAWLVLGGKKKS